MNWGDIAGSSYQVPGSTFLIRIRFLFLVICSACGGWNVGLNSSSTTKFSPEQIRRSQNTPIVWIPQKSAENQNSILYMQNKHRKNEITMQRLLAQSCSPFQCSVSPRKVISWEYGGMSWLLIEMPPLSPWIHLGHNHVALFHKGSHCFNFPLSSFNSPLSCATYPRDLPSFNTS
jgi:hypothetical protein